MLRVLLIDDSPVFLTALAGAMARLPGVQVLATCHSGRDGLNLARQTTPDLVLVDLRMAEIDGIETSRQLRHALPDVTIVIVSLQAPPRTDEWLAACGADAFVRKADLFLQLPQLLVRTNPSGQDAP